MKTNPGYKWYPSTNQPVKTQTSTVRNRKKLRAFASDSAKDLPSPRKVTKSDKMPQLDFGMADPTQMGGLSVLLLAGEHATTAQGELGAVSLDGYFHLWKAEHTLSELLSTQLPYCREKVCLACGQCMQEDHRHMSPFWIPGSLLTMLDPSVPKNGAVACSQDFTSRLEQDSVALPVRSIRWVRFYEHIITVGTGQGSSLFYGIRAQRFLGEKPPCCACYGQKQKLGGNGVLQLTARKGWLVEECTSDFTNAG
ncbi:DDB1- and CUL4-associated factor 12-like [Harpia harpyja]|uniref:DDB1- and CUL4-associated factor 12-like n=1 Tax=Harpia harpyja TaxID=202280 RepID=UPI0022B17077|nr:DDB1- and CUL4-associated factor 12-like [Harpia harpyja]